MTFLHLFVVLPVRVFTAIVKSIFHSWLKLRWTPSSRSWLLHLDQSIRSRIVHKNYAEIVQVEVGNNVHDIWTVFVEGDHRDTVPLVIVHGMGGGSNMFLNNIDALAKQRDIVLLDLPGFGLSGRPELRVKTRNGWWVDTTVDDIEEFYTEVLERWLQRMGLRKIILLAHSYGGYLCSVYCLKYPKRVKHLLLVDPWGYPQRPAAADHRPFMRSKPLYLLSKLYAKMNIFTPIRALGPLGPLAFRTLRSDFSRKFRNFFSDHTFCNYLYACNTCDVPSGEIGFSRVSIPFGWAKKPLVERVPFWDPNLDVTFIYGARSWVDSQPGYETKNQRHDNYVDVHVISGAGHHVYADRPLAFNHMVLMICEAVDFGRKPNISHKFEQRNLAMSSLRRVNSSRSQAEICNDEAGIRAARTMSAHELSREESLDHKEESSAADAVGGVKFFLDDAAGEEEVHSPRVVFNLGTDSISLGKKSTLKTSKQTGTKNVSFSWDIGASSDSESWTNLDQGESHIENTKDIVEDEESGCLLDNTNHRNNVKQDDDISTGHR